MNAPLLALATLSLASCSAVMPGPHASKAQRHALHRAERMTDVGREGGVPDEREVSAVYSANYDESTSDLELLYVHGTPGEAMGWADYLVDPVGGTPSVAIDRPGFGESDHCLLANLQGQSRALAPYLDPKRRVILVGHSYGGPVVLQAALDYPDQVAGVVILAGSISPQLENLHWYNYVAKGVSLVLPEDYVRANQEVWPLHDDLERMAKRLGEIKVPVRIVHGTADGLVPFGNVKYAEEALTEAPWVKVEKLDGAGHMFIWEEKWISQTRGMIEEMILDVQTASE